MCTTALEKAAISAWERRAYDEGMVGHAEIFRNSHPKFVNRGLPGHREPVPQIPGLIDRGKLRVARFHRKFNEHLSRNKFVAGDRFSVADISTITVVDFGHALEMQIPDDCPYRRAQSINVKRWYDEVQLRESVRQSLPLTCQMDLPCQLRPREAAAGTSFPRPAFVGTDCNDRNWDRPR